MADFARHSASSPVHLTVQNECRSDTIVEYANNHQVAI